MERVSLQFRAVAFGQSTGTSNAARPKHYRTSLDRGAEKNIPDVRAAPDGFMVIRRIGQYG